MRLEKFRMATNKFYIHYEGSPTFTMVVQWREFPAKVTFEHLLEQFCLSYNNRHGQKNGLTVEDIGVQVEKGKDIELDSEIEAVVADQMDLFVVPKFGSACYDRDKHKIWGPKLGAMTGLETLHAIQRAESYEGMENYRFAVRTYFQILKSDRLHLKSLMGLHKIYVRAQRHVDALVVIQLAADNYPNEFNLKHDLGRCFLELGYIEEAHVIFIELLEYLEVKLTKLNKMYTTIAHDDIKSAILNAEVDIGKTFLKEGNKDAALQVFADVLKEDRNHIDGLINFALMTADKGKKSLQESIMVMLIVLARHCRRDKKVQSHIAFLAQLPGALDMFKIEMRSSWHSKEAVLYIGGILRDFGATWEAMTFAKHAYQLEKGTAPSTTLFMMHLHETLCNYNDVYKAGCQFFRENPHFKIGGLPCSKIMACFNGIKDINYNQANPKEHEINPHSMIIDSNELSTNETQALGILFLIVKVLFLRGSFNLTTLLLKPLEKLHSGRDLHMTIIRNEAAYFLGVSTMMKVPLQPLPEKPSFIYFFADSHCITPAWRIVVYHGKAYVLHPMIVSGLKVWHLRNESKFYPKSTFFNAIKQIPEGSKVIFNFGELDCRDGLLKAIDHCKYDSLEEGCSAAINEYMQSLDQVKLEGKHSIFIHPVLPVLKETRGVVQVFNKELKRKSKVWGFKWLRFLDSVIMPDATFNPEFTIDGTHAHPRYVALIEKALNAY